MYGRSLWNLLDATPLLKLKGISSPYFGCPSLGEIMPCLSSYRDFSWHFWSAFSPSPMGHFQICCCSPTQLPHKLLAGSLWSKATSDTAQTPHPILLLCQFADSGLGTLEKNIEVFWVSISLYQGASIEAPCRHGAHFWWLLSALGAIPKDWPWCGASSRSLADSTWWEHSGSPWIRAQGMGIYRATMLTEGQFSGFPWSSGDLTSNQCASQQNPHVWTGCPSLLPSSAILHGHSLGLLPK